MLDVPSVESFSIVQSMHKKMGDWWELELFGGGQEAREDGLYKDDGFPRLICMCAISVAAFV